MSVAAQKMAANTAAAPAGAAPQPGDMLMVIHDFQARSPDELSLIRGELIELIEKDDGFGDGWYLGKHLLDGRTGLFPEVYTRLAPAPIAAAIPSSRNDTNRQSSLPEKTTSSIFAATNPGDTMATPNLPTNQNNVYDAHTPAPLNPAGSNQRAVSAPQTVLPTFATNNVPMTQNGMGMVIDDNRVPGPDSSVITETLGVIDEHITEMNTPRSSMLASPRNKNGDSGSEYSSHVDHRLSYITGNETDEEDNLTQEQVVSWNPAQAAQYLHEIGVEQRHCDVFQEQEITGEVLMNLEKSELFMPELDLGPIGRRLATWHKIKAFQEELKSKRGIGTPSVTGSTSASIPSVNGPGFSRGIDSAYRPANYRYSQQNSPMIPEDDSAMRLPQVDPSTRPSAAAMRELNQHSRRTSSIDYTKSDRGTPPMTPGIPTSLHRPHSSFDKSWTLPVAQMPGGGRSPRASSMMSSGAGSINSSGMPPVTDRRAVTSSVVDLANKTSASPLADLDRGYLSSGEAETSKSKIRNLLRKSQPNSRNHSRQNSGNNDTRSILSGTSTTRRHSRFGSAGSIFGALDKQLEFHPTLGHQTAPPSPPLSRTESKALTKVDSAGRSRTLSLRNSSGASRPSTTTTLVGAGQTSSVPAGPLTAPAAVSLATTTTDTPIVTKLDYTESPTSITSKSTPVSPVLKSDGFVGPLSRVASTLRSSKRSSSDAVTGIEKSQISSPVMPATVEEAPQQSPARTGSTSPSAASKSIEMDTTPDTSVKGIIPVPTTASGTTSRTVSASTKKSKSKKETSAYKSLKVISPEKAAEDCSHSGWMHKKSAKMTSTFKLRYFVLKDKRLSYFYSLEDKIEKGLIDINAHRVEQVEHDLVTSLYATLAGTKSGLTTPANPAAAAGTSTPTTNQSHSGPFFFKLVPPRTGLSKAVQFTRPAVHFFAVDNYEDGREWFLALKKASIDRDETQAVTTTYTQKTISLAKAQEQRQRPPALMNTEDLPEPKAETAAVDSAKSIETGETAVSVEDSKTQFSEVQHTVTSTDTNGAIEDAASPQSDTIDENVSGVDQNPKILPSEQSTANVDAHPKDTATLRIVDDLNEEQTPHNEAPVNPSSG